MSTAVRSRVMGTDPHSRAVRAYVSGRMIDIRVPTLEADRAAQQEWEAMWRRRYARDARRPTSVPALRDRYLSRIANTASEVASELFGRGINVSVQYGDRDSVAWLGGPHAVVTYSGQLGPRALRAELLRQAGQLPELLQQVDRGLTQSLHSLTHPRY